MFSYFIKTNRKLVEALRFLPRALKLVKQASGRWLIAWLGVLLAQGALPVAIVYLTKRLVDALVMAANKHGGLGQIVRPAALMLILILLGEALRSLEGLIRKAQSELLSDHIGGLIHEQSARVDYAFYELPEYYDHLHRAREEAGYRVVDLIESLGRLLQDGITLIGMAAVVTAFEWWLPLALLVSTVPALLVVLRQTLKQHQWRIKHTADERRAWYFDWLLTTDEAAAEMRLFNLGQHFQKSYRAVRVGLRAGQLRLARQASVAEFLAGIVALAVTGAAMLWMARRVVIGAASLGTLALFYQAFNQGQALMRALLGQVGQLYASSLFLSGLFEFLALEPKINDPLEPLEAPRSLIEGIEFDRVTFSYPNSERAALREFNLKIPAGKVTAIVGLNGAGKTTLIKLLCRLYDPDSGSIKFDGVDARRLRLADLRRMVTALFQQPVRYSATVAENIRLGDVTSASDQITLRAAAEAAGAQTIIERLPDGSDSLLGKRFADGHELSVGEWQRVALARAFWRNAPVVLLDEPTSARDSWAEIEWMKQFGALAAGRTVLMITHRFTTAMQADLIHVMVAGRIVESGDHQSLIKLGGIYAQSWRAQVEG